MIALNLPDGEHQRSFLDHFNAALRSVSSNYSGSAGFRPDGTFQSSVTLALPVADQPVTLAWTVTKMPDGTLKDIAVETASEAVGGHVWQPRAQALVTSALADALSEKRRRFFRRVRFHYLGPALDGEYWLPGFRVGPVPPDDAAPMLINAERVVYLDFYVDAIDDMHANGVAQEVGRRHAARLSLLLNIGLFSSPSGARWVLPHESGSPITESKRYLLGFLDSRPQPSDMPTKGAECPLGGYSGRLTEFYRFAGKRLQCPAEARKVLRGIDGAPSRVRDAFDRCARLWQVANIIGEQFPSAGLAYRVAAAEAITQGDPAYAGFADFIQKHATPSAGLRPALEYLYGSVRSAHFHGGEFPLGEFSPVRFFDPLMDVHLVEASNLQTSGYEIIRSAIVNWVLGILPPVEDESE